MKFVIDAGASRFSVQAFATGLLSSFGHNPTIGINRFDGELAFEPETYANFHLRLAVNAGELEVLDEMKKDDRDRLERLMYGEVLNVARFPQAVYESKSATISRLSADIVMGHVAGELSFRGNTKPQDLDARVIDNGDRLRISGEFTLRQSDYGIKPVSFAGGALRLKDELKFKFELVAKKQE